MISSAATSGEKENGDGVDMDIKSLDGFVLGVLVLNTSETLTRWNELHQAPCAPSPEFCQEEGL